MIVLLVSVVCSVAAADGHEDCAAASERIDATLRDEAHRVGVWRLGWGLAAGVGAAAQAGVAVATDDRDLRKIGRASCRERV